MSQSQLVEELKECGNKYMKANPPDYNRAIEAYTKALSIDENASTVLANRSLAFYKLHKYKEALEDGEKAISASPKWPKGYLRKCSALNALKRSHKAQQAAQEGFLLMHSTSFCREFVSQWLTACDDVYNEDKLGELLPPGPAQLFQVMVTASKRRDEPQIFPKGFRVLSDVYWNVLFYCMASRFSPLLSLSHSTSKQYLIEFACEFERIMSLFGHVVGTTVMEWAVLIGESIDDKELLIQTKPQSTKLTENLIRFLSADLHLALYNIASPLLLLAVMIISSRMFMLNAGNTGFHTICHMTTMCLPLFECSPLSASENVHHHMDIMAGLIDAYNRRSTSLSNEDCSVLAEHCKRLESLLLVLRTQFPKLFHERHQQFEFIIGTAKTSIISKSTGVTVPFEMSSSFNETAVSPLENAKERMKIIMQKPTEVVTINDAEEMIDLVETFVNAGDIDGAKFALVSGESLLLPLIGVHFQQGEVTLNEAHSTIRSFRMKVLVAASLLKETNEKLFCDMIVRWKGLFSEFKVMAIREGLRDTFLNTSKEFNNLKTSGTLQKTEISDEISALKKSHQSKIDTFLRHHSYRIWQAVTRFPVLQSLQKVMLKDELIIEYILVGKYDKSSLKASLDLFILLLKPDGSHELCVVSEKACSDAVKKWVNQWNIVTNKKPHAGSEDEKKKLEEVGKELTAVIFPSVIQKCIKDPSVKLIYLCPEPHISLIPMKLLPGEDSQKLFEGRSISYLGSCRELLRLEIMSSNLTSSSDCYVFADPDFDHQLQTPSAISDSLLWEKLSSLNPFHKEPKHCESLEYSLKEGYSIQEIISLCHPELKVHLLHGKEANLQSVISLKSPLILHFSTHGFGNLQFQFDLPDLSQEFSKSGLVLAGFNTYMSSKFDQIDPVASTGMLTSLSVYGINLTNTRLVFLSTCVSGVGATHLQESTNSIASAFRSAGALTVIATTWRIDDRAAAEFVKYFYNSLCVPNTRPSEALNNACEEICKNPDFSSWYYWAGFTCYGDDIPVFSTTTNT